MQIWNQKFAYPNFKADFSVCCNVTQFCSFRTSAKNLGITMAEKAKRRGRKL